MIYDWLKQPPPFACAQCFKDYTYPSDELRVWNGTPFCESCYDQISGEADPDFYDLPEFVPVIQSQLAAAIGRAEKAEALLERMHKKYDYLMYRIGFSGDPYPIDNSIDSEFDQHLREQWQLGRDYAAWKGQP